LTLRKIMVGHFCWRLLVSRRHTGGRNRTRVTWTPEMLDKYVADPQAMIPANRMPYAGTANAADRADLIAYLLKATK
jgi:cytochrome c